MNHYRPYWDGASVEEDCEFFLVHQVSGTTYAIENTASDFEFYVMSMNQFENLNPHLDLPNAFRQKLRSLREEGDPDVLEGASEPLGDAMAVVLKRRLNEALPHPDGELRDPIELHFQCFQLGSCIEVQDNYLALSVGRVAETSSLEESDSDDCASELEDLFKEMEYG